MNKVMQRDWVKHNHSPWYDTPFPPPNHPIIFVPVQITEDLISGVLPEYNREAFALPSNLTRRRVRSLSKIIRLGHEKLVVLADQSVNADSSTLLEVTVRSSACSLYDIEEHTELIKAKNAQKRLSAVSAKSFYRLDSLYSLLWKAIRLHNVTPPSVYAILQLIASKEQEILAGLEVPQNVYQELVVSAGGVLRKTFSLYFTSYLGIDGVKQVLKKTQLSFQPMDTENWLKFSYVAAPYYEINIRARRQYIATEQMNLVLKMIAEEAKGLGGMFSVDDTEGKFQTDI